MENVQNNPRMGLRDGLPIGLGYLAISFAFGILATSTEMGLTVIEALMISMTNLTSAGQLAAVPIIAKLGSLIELAMTQLVINLRYSLMSISLSQKLDKQLELRWRFLLAFTLTDEIYATGISKEQPLGKKYMLCLLLFPYLGWSLGTLLGAIAGNILPAIIVSALGVAMYAMFIAIFVPAARDSSPILAAVIIAISIGLLFEYLPLLSSVPDGFVIIIAAVTASALMAVIKPISQEDDEQKQESPPERTEAGNAEVADNA